MFKIPNVFSSSNFVSLHASATNPLANEITVAIVSVLFNSIFEQLASLWLKALFRNSQVKDSKQAAQQSSKTLEKKEIIIFDEDTKFQLDRILADVDCMVQFLEGKITRGTTCTMMFLGPPGTGKTSALRLIYQWLNQKAQEYAYKPILLDLSDEEREEVLKARAQIRKNKKIKSVFIPGSFFAGYGEFRLEAMQHFFQTVAEWLRDGEIVFIGFDEVDPLLACQANSTKTNLTASFLFYVDWLQNIIAQEKLSGRLVMVSTTNGGYFDMAVARRLMDSFIAFNYPSLQLQQTLLIEKLDMYVASELKRKKPSTRFQFEKEVLHLILQKNLHFFLQNGINFTGAAAENIVKNFCGRLAGLPDDKIVKYGESLSEQASNLLKILLIEEALKILRIQQRKFSAVAQKIIDELFVALQILSTIPKINAGADWVLSN